MEKFKILAEFIKDISSETKDAKTYLFVKDYISKYQLTIDITSEPTKNKLIEVIFENDATYSPLALYFIIDNEILTENREINKLFDQVINKTKLDKEIKNLIIYKKALFNSDFTSENELLNILNPIINSESIWKSHALYLLAEYFYSKNEKKKAKEFFNKIVGMNNSNQNIKVESQKRLNRDF